MKIGLVGGSYQERSLPFDAQRSINLYPVIDETKQGKEVAALYGTPGLNLIATIGIGAIRGVFSSTNGRAFVISNGDLYEIFADGTYTLRGMLVSTSSILTIEENTTQMAICDGTNLYIFTYATNILAVVSDPDLPAVATVTYLDGYFICNKVGSGEFYISTLQNGTSWAALDFATAESSPDGLVRPFATLGQLWLFGERTTELWYNSSDVLFPFVRVQGGKMETGCASAHSVINIDNTVFWLGKNKDGWGVVYRAQGFTPIRISTFAIEHLINKLTDLSAIRAYGYIQDGHAFYVLTGGGLETTIVYDAATKLWHERAFLETNGKYSTHKASSCMFAFGKHIVGDRINGNIYELSLNAYSDGGQTIKRQRTFTHISNEGKMFRANALQVDFEYGVGLASGQGSNPTARLEISEDGGKTWSPEYEASIGRIGEYKARAVWRRLGVASIMTFRITISDPVKVAICGAYLK